MSKNKIGLATATIIGMNAMIGAGIFVVPAGIAITAGPTGLLTYLFVIFTVLFTALTLARLAQLFPQEGSFYIYAKQWGGHTAGVLASVSYLIGLLIAMGLLCQVSGGLLHHYFPGVDPYNLGLYTLLILTALNSVGVIFSQAGQIVLIFCTVFPLITTTLMCLTKTNFINFIPTKPIDFVNVLQATKAVIFGFFGFECMTSLFSIIKKPEKNLPKAVVISISLVSVIYFLFTGSIIGAIPISAFTNTNIQIPELLKPIFPGMHWVIEGIHLSMLAAVLGTVHSMIWSSGSLLLSITKKLKNNTIKKLVSNKILNPKTSILIIASCILTSFVFLKNQNLFFSFTAIFIPIAYILSMITLLTLKSEWKSKQNIKTIIGIIAALVILVFAIEGVVGQFV